MFKIETVSHLDMTETIVDKTICDQTLPWVGLPCVTVVFQDHTCLISYMGFRGRGAKLLFNTNGDFIQNYKQWQLPTNEQNT